MTQNTAANFPQASQPMVDVKTGQPTESWRRLFVRLWEKSFSSLDTNLTPQGLLDQAVVNAMLFNPPRWP